MRNRTIALLATLGAVLAAPILIAQSPFPQTLAPNTVVGRLGVSAGPAQQIPFANLFAGMFGGAVPAQYSVLLSGGAGGSLGGATIGTAGRLLIDQGAGANPAFTAPSGLFTMAANGVATLGTLPAASVANSNLANMAAATIKGSIAGGVPADLTPGQVGGILCVPSRTVLTSGTAQTYTTPTCNGVTATSIEVEMVGGGGGASGSGTGATNGTTGNSTTFGALTANGGVNGTAGFGAGGAGGTATGCDDNITGGNGVTGTGSAAAAVAFGQSGGGTFYGPGGIGGVAAAAGGNGIANTGGGGGCAGTSAGVTICSSGGGGGYCRKLITLPSATYTYTVAATAANGAGGTSGANGGSGAAGRISVTAHWQ